MPSPPSPNWTPQNDDAIWNAPPDPHELNELARRLDAYADLLVIVADRVGGGLGSVDWAGVGFLETTRGGEAAAVNLRREVGALREVAASSRSMAAEAQKAWDALYKQKILGIFGVVLSVALLFVPIGAIVNSIVSGLRAIIGSVLGLLGKLGGVLPENLAIDLVLGQIAALPLSLLWPYVIPEVIASAISNDWSFNPTAFGMALGFGAVFGLPFLWRGARPGGAGASGAPEVTGQVPPAKPLPVSFGSSPSTTLGGASLGSRREQRTAIPTQRPRRRRF